ARAAAERGDLAFGTVDTWLMWKLTGGTVHATDRTNASRTMLFDLDRMCWDPALLDALRVPAAVLPEVHPSVSRFGTMAGELLGDGLGLINAADDTEAIAASVPDSGGVIIVPAFVGLGAPHWDMYARGAILGLTRGSSRAHLVRATLESIALQTLDVVEAME